MNKYASTAIALVAVGSVGFADPGDNDWDGLDSEINSLASSLAPAQGSGSGWSVLLRSASAYGWDDYSEEGGDDYAGFKLKDVDLALWGASGDFLYRVSIDFDGEGGGFINGGDQAYVEDAYADWECGTYATARIGKFKANVLRSATIDPEDTLFIDRTVMGSAFDMWDEGISAFGSQENVDWSASIQNGPSGTEVDHAYSLRLAYDFGMGAGAFEGARDGNDDFNATVGAALTNTTAQSTGDSDNTSFWFDLNGNYQQFGFGAELGIVDNDDGGRPVSNDWGVLGDTIPVFLDDDSTPFAFTGSYLINPEIEVGARFEDLDDDQDTTVITIGASYYRNGSNAKWQAQFTDVDRDDDDGSYAQVGLTVGASR